MQSGYIFKIFPSIGLVKEVEDDSAVTVLNSVVAFVDVVAVLAADVVTQGVGAFLRELVGPGSATVKDIVPLLAL
jgi:hypothetical protein